MEILITKPGVISRGDKQLLRKNGIACIEAESPKDVRLIQSESLIGGDELTWAALQALSAAGSYTGDQELRRLLDELVRNKIAALGQSND